MFRSVESRIEKLSPKKERTVRRMISVSNITARQALNIVTSGQAGPVFAAVDATLHAERIFTYPHEMRVRATHAEAQLDQRVRHQFSPLELMELEHVDPQLILQEGRRLRDRSVEHIEARRKVRSHELHQRQATEAAVNITGLASQVFTDIRAVGLLGGVQITAQRVAEFFAGKGFSFPEASSLWNSARFWVGAVAVTLIGGIISFFYQRAQVGEVRASVNALKIQETKIKDFAYTWERAFRQRYHLTKIDGVKRFFKGMWDAYWDGHNGKTATM
jgi:hypothetical protein